VQNNEAFQWARIFCSTCGSEVPHGQFCHKCGARLPSFTVKLTASAEQKIISDPEWGNWQAFQEYVNRNERRMHPVQSKESGASQFKLRAGNAVMRLSHEEASYVAIDVYRQAQPEPDYVDRWKENPFRLLSNGESLIVDGSNLVRAGRDCRHGKEEKCNKPGIVRRLSQLFEQAEESKRAKNVTGECIVVVDASLRYHVDDEAKLQSLIDEQMVKQAPSTYEADSLILKLADDKNGIVMSNDVKMRREYADEYPWVVNKGRFIQYTPISDEEMLYGRKMQVQGDIVPSLIEILPPHRPKQQPNIIQRTRGWAERIQGILDIVPIWVVCPYCRAWNFMNPRATQSQLCQRCGHRLR